MNLKKENILGYECKFVTYTTSTLNDVDDCLFVKENIHYKHDDGTIEYIPNLRPIENYKRDFFITKKGYRNHTDKKEAEDINKLTKYETTQRTMLNKICNAYRKPKTNARLKMLARDNFLYGTDINTSTIIKKKYQEKFPNLFSENSIAALDIETEEVEGTKEIILLSIAMKDEVILYALKSYTDKTPDFVEQFNAGFDTRLKEYIGDRKIKQRLVILDTPGQMCYQAIQVLHKWKPDFVSIYNLSFDISFIIDALENENYNLADVFSDPSVPRHYRYFEFKKGMQGKKTASGKQQPLSPHEQWHTVICPSSFYFICSMSTYAFIRKAKGNEPSYKLGYILNKILGVRKMNFKEADGYIDLSWHVFMQKNYPVLYAFYNVFDTFSLLMLDEATKDLAVTLPQQTEYNEFSDFNSTPKQICNDLYFVYREKGMITAACSDNMKTEFDDLVVTMRGWIVTLAAHLIEDNGLAIYYDAPTIRTLIRAHVADLDVKSSYPYTQIFSNISKRTTILELISIQGIPDNIRRQIGINLTGGKTNALEFAQTIYNFPTIDRLVEEYDKIKNAA